MSSNANTTQDRSLIADKELHYLKDYLSWELLAMKKCGDLAGQIQDPDMARFVKDVGQKHQDHYNTLLTLLKS